MKERKLTMGIDQLLLLFTVFALSFCHGESEMQCYSYTCSNFTNTKHPTCAPPKIITCPIDHHSPVPPNRCMTQRLVAELEGTIIEQEIRGCTDSFKCQSNKLCDQAKIHGNIKHCKTTCCEGSLCNREGPVARHVAADPGAPSGADLSCYACSTPIEPMQPSPINCTHPIRQQCGDDPLTDGKQDRCVTIQMTSHHPGGPVVYQVMRHCASAHYCGHGYCVQANITGVVTSCKASCCYGNMCNDEGLRSTVMTSTMKSTLNPTTAVHKEVFARQGGGRLDRVSTVEVQTFAAGMKQEAVLQLIVSSVLCAFFLSHLDKI